MEEDESTPDRNWGSAQRSHHCSETERRAVLHEIDHQARPDDVLKEELEARSIDC
jgi:hypothetical protein